MKSNSSSKSCRLEYSLKWMLGAMIAISAGLIGLAVYSEAQSVKIQQCRWLASEYDAVTDSCRLSASQVYRH